MTPVRPYRAGQSIEDHCRSCHEDRTHLVVAAGADGQVLRVQCGFCGSQHNYRGGPRKNPPMPASPNQLRQAPAPAASSAAERAAERDQTKAGSTFPSAALRPPTERVATTGLALPMTTTSVTDDLEILLRRIIREETGWSPVEPAEKWRGGELVLKPGKPGLQDKTWPIDSFFHKIVMLRNRLRTLEQQVNASDLPDDQKLKLQAYVTGCYGTLTSFNVLFADEDDRFSGSGQD